MHAPLSHAQRQALCLQQLTYAISLSRLGRFQKTATSPPWEALANYAWNVAICEALYPLFHHAEVVLRNAMDEAISTAYPTGGIFKHVDSWMDSPSAPLGFYARNDVEKAKKKLLGWDDKTMSFRKPPTSITHPDLVAAVDFGCSACKEL